MYSLWLWCYQISHRSAPRELCDKQSWPLRIVFLSLLFRVLSTWKCICLQRGDSVHDIWQVQRVKKEACCSNADQNCVNHNKWWWKRQQQMVAAVALSLGFDLPALLHYKFRYKPNIEKLQVPRWQLSCQSLDILFLGIACCRVASRRKDVLHPMQYGDLGSRWRQGIRRWFLPVSCWNQICSPFFSPKPKGVSNVFSSCWFMS